MNKVTFRYGVVGASKTANMLMMRYNYLERGKMPVLLKPKIENRDGATTIKSRIGLSAECLFAEDYIENPFDCDIIIVDESQFLTVELVEDLISYADKKDIPIVFYGLKTDFMSNLFEGSKRIIELADELEEIPTICWCGRKARFNARIINGEIVDEGTQIVLGGNKLYAPLCRQHYLSKNLGDD